MRLNDEHPATMTLPQRRCQHGWASKGVGEGKIPTAANRLTVAQGCRFLAQFWVVGQSFLRRLSFFGLWDALVRQRAEPAFWPRSTAPHSFYKLNRLNPF